LVIFANNSISPLLSNLDCGLVPTGAGGILGERNEMVDGEIRDEMVRVKW